MKRITVYVITYNQEDTIARALDSVLCQKEWGLYKIIVSDDCSRDRTWDILKEYQTKYSDIIELHRNSQNLGIYKNMEVVESLLPESDLYSGLAGDDEYCDGYFEGIQALLFKEKIDTTKAIGVFSDWKAVFPDGKEVVYKQDLVQTGFPLFSLKMRGKISGRSLMKSRIVQGAYGAMLKGKGLNLTESYHDSQPHLKIKEIYYLPEVTTVSYRGIGVSSRLSLDKSDYYTTQSIEKWQFALEHFIHDDRDMHYAKYEITKAEFYQYPKWSLLFRMFYHYVKGILPGCRNSLKDTARMFLGFIKYKCQK